MRHLRSSSLKSRLLLPIAAGGFAAALIASGLQFYGLSQRQEALHILEAQRIASTLHYAAEFAPSPEALQGIVVDLAKTNDVASIALMTTEPPEILAAFPIDWVGLSPHQLGDSLLCQTIRSGGELHEPTTRKGAGWLDVAVPIAVALGQEPRILHEGTVIIRLDGQRMRAATWRSAAMQAVWIMVLTAVCLVGAFVLFDHALFRRLDRIARAIRARQAGDPSSRAPIDRPDEVAGLARVLNQAFDAVADRETRFRSVVDTAVEGIVIIDDMGTIESFNAAAEKIFGYRQEEVLGLNVSTLMPSPHAERHDTYIVNHNRSSRSHALGTNREVQGLRKDGTTFPLEASVSKMNIGDRVYFTGMLRDITERHEAEEALREYARQLEEANRVAEEATRTKSSFLANMSHEIRTPMTAILGYVDLMSDGDMPDQERDEALGTIRNNGVHLLSIINDILDISKVEAGRMEVERIDADLGDLLLDVENLLRLRAEEKGIALVFEQDGPLPRRVLTDPTRVRQILVNLIGNAIKFTEEGRVRICTRFVPHDGRNCIRVRIEDTGIGMNDDQIQHLFQPFSQADTSTTRRFGGTGLGLVISKRLAELLGGDILVESEEGCGSVFTVGFDAGPIDEEESFTDLHALRDGRVSRRSAPVSDKDTRVEGRVLLVEDNAVNQKLITRMLVKAGASVETADNGLLAVERILDEMSRGNRFDLVLMDMLMPVLDGYAATSRIREEGYEGPIVALTGNAMEGDRERCLAAGCDDYLTKPIDRKALSAILAARLQTIEDVLTTA